MANGTGTGTFVGMTCPTTWHGGAEAHMAWDRTGRGQLARRTAFYIHPSLLRSSSERRTVGPIYDHPLEDVCEGCLQAALKEVGDAMVPRDVA